MNLKAWILATITTCSLGAADYHKDVDLGKVKPGDNVQATAEPPGRVITGNIVNSGGWPWIQNSLTSFSSIVPESAAGLHDAQFGGTFVVDGSGGGSEVPTWTMNAKADLRKKIVLSGTFKPTTFAAIRTAYGMAHDPSIGDLRPTIITTYLVVAGGIINVTSTDRNPGNIGFNDTVSIEAPQPEGTKLLFSDPNNGTPNFRVTINFREDRTNSTLRIWAYLAGQSATVTTSITDILHAPDVAVENSVVTIPSLSLILGPPL